MTKREREDETPVTVTDVQTTVVSLPGVASINFVNFVQYDVL